MSSFIEIVIFTTLTVLAMIGWGWLMHFPWAWALHIILIFQTCLLFFVLCCEYSAKSVNGAAGWVTVAFYFVQGIYFILMPILKFLVWVGQSLGWI